MQHPLTRHLVSATARRLFIAATLAAAPAYAITDLLKWPAGLEPSGQTNGPDTLDDIWQGVFNAWALDPNGDEDNDGCSNWIESIAGTNPFSSSDCLKVGAVVITGGNIIFTIKAEEGKKYRILCSDSPVGPTWTPVAMTSPVAAQEYVAPADDNALHLTVTKAPDSKKFYKVETSDADSDNDSVSDWAERKLGLNPNAADSDLDGVPDGTIVAQELQTPDVVTIVATKAIASEDPLDSGEVMIKRTRSLLPMTVHYSVSGTASGGSDFAMSQLTSPVTLPAGVKEQTVSVTPAQDAVLEGSESVTVSLTSATTGAYPDPSIGTPDNATVIINNSTVPSGTGLTARYYDNASTTFDHAVNFGDNGNYTYTRSGASAPYTGAVVVTPTGLSAPRLATILAAVSIGGQVKLSFNGGNLNTAAYTHQNYTVTAKTGTNFTCSLPSSASLPASSSSSCGFSVQPIHPAVIERVDATVDNDWAYGTPGGNTITGSDFPDNFSSSWEGYLNPTTSGGYTFQLDADDKARVLIDLDHSGTFDPPGEQVIEHGWDAPATVGTFNVSGTVNLTAAAVPADRYRIRVEHVDASGDARCRFQWKVPGTTTFANIPQANVYTHLTSMGSYSYTRTVTTPGAMSGNIVVTLTGHTFAVNDVVNLSFSSGNLFTPANGNFHGTYTVSAVTTTTFTVPISAASLPATGTGAGYVLDQPNSTTTGWLNYIYGNTTFTGAPGRVGIDGGGATNTNNGIWGSGTPDPLLINHNTFTVRWTGQVQPQFTEEYTFVVHADDGCKLSINGVVQPLQTGSGTNQSGSTYTYNRTTGDLVVSYPNLIIAPDSFTVGEMVRIDPSSGNLVNSSGSAYTYDSGTGDAVIDYSNLTNITPGSIVVGEMIEVDPTSGSVNLGQLPYTVTAATTNTFTVNFGAGTFASGSGLVTVSDVRNAVVTAVTPTTFTVNVGAGKYTDGSTGNVSLEIVNKVLKDWSSMGNERFVRIPMIGGTRYNIDLQYYENTGYSRCRLFWYSPGQTKQIIPTDRLYPSTGPLAPAAHITPTEAVALVGGPFSIPISGSNGASVSLSGAPAWLTYSNGVLSGTPPPGSAGEYQIIITITGPDGTSTSVLSLHVNDTGGHIDREYWNSSPGTTVADIPTGSAPSGTDTLTSLEAPTDFGDNYGARIHGYITAPETGNYYFWIAANNAAELWIANDGDPVNTFRRAWVTTGSATPHTWSAEANQRSPWLALEQGHRYYIEILHKAGTGAGDNLAVGWSKPGGSDSAPDEIVPGYALSPYVAPTAGPTSGTLYVASLLSQNNAATTGVGSSTLRLSEDENTAYMRYSYSGLTGPITSQHIHTDPYLSKPSTIVYDIDTPATPGDGLITDPADPNNGSYKWTIGPVGTLTKADIIEIIKQGKAYINLHTAMYPNGEIRGNYTLANGTRSFTPPPAPPSWTDDSNTDAGAVRFLTQATYGASVADIQALKALSPSGASNSRYETWIDDQFTKPASHQLAEVLRTEGSSAQGGNFTETLTFNAWWWNSIAGDDQLRQRVAFALSEIHVVSAQGPLSNNAMALSYFYDKLADNAFGNFRDILVDTTLTPSMGRYLDMLRNDKPDITIGRSPNENYAREIKQLFSIGLYRLWPDGSLMLSESDAPIDTYTQREIVGLAHVFTGWDYGYDGDFRTSIGATTNWMRQMREVPARHFTGTKRVLNNEVMPGLLTLGGQTLDPYATHNTTHFVQAAYQNLPAQELAHVHEMLFEHPNTGPFICRQLIQRLVTSNPSRDYLYRVVQKFNDNGSGVRGDMKAVIKAILLDYEARSGVEITKPDYGKQREAVMRVAASARAFRTNAWSGTYAQNASPSSTQQRIVITTPTPHKLVSGNSVFLDFTSATGGPAPWIGAYSVSVTNATTFYVNAQGWATGTYSIPANSTTCTVTMSNHWLQTGHKVYIDFTSGAADGVSGLDKTVYTLTSATAETGTNGTFTFDIATPASTSARTGNMALPRFSPGSYTTSSSGLPAPNDRRVTMDTNADHHLNVGDQVQINFFGGNPLPVDMVATVESVIDLNTWTFLAPSADTNLGTTQGNNSVYQFPLVSQPLTRSGNVSSRPSTFNMGNTNSDLDQSPLNSPTVFNFYLPEFKFPGALASQGITTPEFQSTAETSVVRQANFIFNAIYNPSNNVTLGSFKTGSNALVMDFGTWIGNATDAGLGAGTDTTKPWTDDVNLDSLIEKMNVLLLAGQLSSGAKTIIKNHVLSLTRGRQISSLSNNSASSTYTQVNTPVAHNLSNGASVTISGITGGTFTGDINGTYTISNVASTSFRVPVPYLSSSGISTANGRVNTSVAYTNGGTAPDADKRDRLNAILQLILTSPDYLIQR